MTTPITYRLLPSGRVHLVRDNDSRTVCGRKVSGEVIRLAPREDCWGTHEEAAPYLRCE